MSGVYYPSALAQLHVRLYDRVGTLPSEALAVLRGQVDAGDVTGLKAFATPADDLSAITAILPASFTLGRNSHRAADTLTLQVRALDLPIPTRMIRSLGVLLFSGTVRPEDFARGHAANAAGQPGPNMAVIRPARENLRFIGFSDRLHEDHEGGFVELEGRDYTGILIDTPVSPDVYGIDIDRPLDEVITDILATVPGGAASGMRVVVPSHLRVDDARGIFVPNLSGLPKVSDTSPAASRRRKGKEARLSAKATGGDLSYWDLITDLCVAAGYLPHVQLDELVLSTPRTLLGREAPGTFRRVIGGEVTTVRRMVHGQNIARVRFDQRFGRLHVPGVEVRSLVPGRSAPLVVRWPPPPTKAKGKERANKALPSGRGASEQVETIIVRGVEDPRLLVQVAAGVYEELGRQQLGGSLETSDLASFGGGNSDPDLLDLVSGDPLEVVVQERGVTQDIASYLETARSPVEMLRRLVERGWDRRVAQSVVNLYLQTRALATIYRVQESSERWQLSGASPSVRISVRFGTYLQPLHEPVPALPVPLGEVPTVRVVG